MAVFRFIHIRKLVFQPKRNTVFQMKVLWTIFNLTQEETG
jgi:hypothetical protein